MDIEADPRISLDAADRQARVDLAAQYELHDRGRASAERPGYLRLLDGIASGCRA